MFHPSIGFAAAVMSAPDPHQRYTPTSVSELRDPAEIVVVIDDDPTGSQSVRGVPLLTSWSPDDLRWAFDQGCPGVYVLTNSRSLTENDAVRVTADVVRAATRAAEVSGRRPVFVSRSDSTLRGHFPAETDVIIESARADVSGVVLVPAFPAAGRLTLHGIHYVERAGELIPVSATEFARDATFGFESSYLPDYVHEKTSGATAADDVLVIDIGTVRAGVEAIAERLGSARGAVPIVVDVLDEHDLIVIALGFQQAESRGQRFVYRVGPAFVRARLGQDTPATVQPSDFAFTAETAAHGLVVVGSHTKLTTAQLAELHDRYAEAVVVEIPVEAVSDAAEADRIERECIQRVVEALPHAHVIVQTSRNLVRFHDPEASLALSRRVSQVVVNIVAGVLAALPPKFVVAKGGITSHDVAARGLSISRAMIVGPMLPGLVSLLRPVGGPAEGIPYVVFPGNVGGEGDLLSVVCALAGHAVAS